MQLLEICIKLSADQSQNYSIACDTLCRQQWCTWYVFATLDSEDNLCNAFTSWLLLKSPLVSLGKGWSEVLGEGDGLLKKKASGGTPAL